jgi:GxxExxY protein
MNNLLYNDKTYKIIGAGFEVYNDKGCGFSEPVYQECFEIELEYQDIPFKPQVELQLAYRERLLKHRYIPDIICYDTIIIELKAVTKLTDEHRAQVMNYLKATECQLGLLINFGHYPRLEYERLINTYGRLCRKADKQIQTSLPRTAEHR